jgi:hypothetical protein
MSSFEPKDKQKYFCISALASKMGQIIKNNDSLSYLLVIIYLASNIIICILFLFDLGVGILGCLRGQFCEMAVHEGKKSPFRIPLVPLCALKFTILD